MSSPLNLRAIEKAAQAFNAHQPRFGKTVIRKHAHYGGMHVFRQDHNV
jgi:hypothetical protein